MSAITDEPHFKTCPMCNAQWESLETFLEDRDLSFNGYQANFGILDEGLFFFTHNTEDCGSTMALTVETFGALYAGDRYTERKLFSENCPRLCNDPKNLERCERRCEYAYAREISQAIKVAMEQGLHVAINETTSPKRVLTTPEVAQSY